MIVYRPKLELKWMKYHPNIKTLIKNTTSLFFTLKDYFGGNFVQSIVQIQQQKVQMAQTTLIYDGLATLQKKRP